MREGINSNMEQKSFNSENSNLNESMKAKSAKKKDDKYDGLWTTVTSIRMHHSSNNVLKEVKETLEAEHDYWEEWEE